MTETLKSNQPDFVEPLFVPFAVVDSTGAITASFQFRVERLQLERIIEFSLQFPQAGKKSLFYRSCRGISGVVITLERFRREIMQSRHFRPGREDLLPTLVHHCPPQIG